MLDAELTGAGLMRNRCAFTSRDMGADWPDAFTYAVVMGWDPIGLDDTDAMAEVARKFGWDSALVEFLRDAHRRFEALPDRDLLPEPHLSGLPGDTEHVADLLPGGSVGAHLGNNVPQGVLGLGDDVAAPLEAIGGGLAAVSEVGSEADQDCGVVDVHGGKDGLTPGICQAILDLQGRIAAVLKYCEEVDAAPLFPGLADTDVIRKRLGPNPYSACCDHHAGWADAPSCEDVTP